MKIVKIKTVAYDENGTEYIIHSHCLRCGRKLKTDEAKVRGFGRICWEKHLSDKQETLF